MENQHRQIKGYRELTQVEIDLMNEIKRKGAELELLCSKVVTHFGNQVADAVVLRNSTIEDQREQGLAETDRLIAANPAHWTDLAITDLQTGLMALTRAVAQPTFF